MKTITLEELLEAGCHFGHQITRQNPKARDYIFEARDGIHIIDLTKTKEGLEQAATYIKDLAKRGKSLIIVGTKRQARNIVEDEVKRVVNHTKSNSEQTPLADKQEKSDGGLREEKESLNGGLFYVTNRWVGGILTNFPEITKNIKRFKNLTQRLQSSEAKAGYTKKEIGLWEKERANLESLYAGIAGMRTIPDAVFIIDTHLENLVVREARKMGVVTIGIADTNADPYLIDYPIPANDDAVGSIKLITGYLIDAWIEGKQKSIKGKPNDLKDELKVTKKKASSIKEKPKVKKEKSVKKDSKE